MSADNEISILEMIDINTDRREYRVADNICMSYNALPPNLDLSIHWQGPMIYEIWKDAKQFYNNKDAWEYANKLEEEGYYEYGTSTFSGWFTWEDVIKAKVENECPDCQGEGYVECEKDYPEPCKICEGSGLKKPYEE